MLDTHTHLLPNMDDGSKSPLQSREMLQTEALHGVDRVILTPHFYADRESPEAFLSRRARAYDLLKAELAGVQGLPRLYLGAEVAYFRGMSRVEQIDQLCIGRTKAMLIEMPFCKWDRSILDEILFLREYRGIQPILAHIERYAGGRSSGTLRPLCEAGLWIQSNASFFSAWQTSRRAMRLLKRQEIHFIGSDCHDTTRRPPNLRDAIHAIDRRLGEPARKYLTNMESMLLEGE